MRDALRLGPGDYVSLAVDRHRIVLTKVKPDRLVDAVRDTHGTLGV